jgi:hypothetical protein
MAPLLSNVLELIRAGRGGQRCLVCGKHVSEDEPQVRLRHDDRVHRGCATYSMRRRRHGSERLGHPGRGR